MREALNRGVLASAVLKRSPHAAHYQAAECIIRNGRWGTCVACPRVDGIVYPERCERTDRCDHHIDWTKNDVFYFDHKTLTKNQFLALINRP